jgi:hypothetical protein
MKIELNLSSLSKESKIKLLEELLNDDDINDPEVIEIVSRVWADFAVEHIANGLLSKVRDAKLAREARIGQFVTSALSPSTKEVKGDIR